ILQHNQARRERQAEQTASHATTVPQLVVNILLIEENSADIALFHYALHELALPCRMIALTQRSEVEDFVRQAATSASLPTPRLIITDYLIPGMEAEEILAALRRVPGYHHIPILLFSSLEEAEGQRRSVQCGATAFVHKPSDLEAFVTVVAT